MPKEKPSNIKIGLEVHCQLTALKTKIFCSCPTDYRDKEPNSSICPVCFGLPGALPVLNKKAVDMAVMIGLALNCEIAKETTFFRKNYFYPDLPKGFQISQYDKGGGIPLARKGFLQVGTSKIRIRRIQVEEDPGRLVYEGAIDKSAYVLVDYNRSGTALVEIVTEPDLRSPKEARSFLEKLRTMLEEMEVSNGELEGAMRCDANISFAGAARVEIKNISSFREVEKALNYEILRQGTFKGATRAERMETRHWDEKRSITISMRTKEEEQDYRYFPELDLPPVEISAETIARVKSEMPKTSEQRASEYVEKYGLNPQIATEISRDGISSQIFALASSLSKNPSNAWASALSGLLTGEYRSYLEAASKSGEHRIDSNVAAGLLDELADLLSSQRINRSQAKTVMEKAIFTGKQPYSLVEEMNLQTLEDEELIGRVVDQVVAKDSSILERSSRDPKVMNYLIGQVLKIDPSINPRAAITIVQRRIRK